jgi:hypothetical protein
MDWGLVLLGLEGLEFNVKDQLLEKSVVAEKAEVREGSCVQG